MVGYLSKKPNIFLDDPGQTLKAKELYEGILFADQDSRFEQQG
jgi:hypothetical protein